MGNEAKHMDNHGSTKGMGTWTRHVFAVNGDARS